jgi:hypothetical protein
MVLWVTLTFQSRARGVDEPTHRHFARPESNGRPCPKVEIRVAIVAIGSLSDSLSAKVKDGVEDGTKVDSARSPALPRGRQNRRNPGPSRVGQISVIEASAHRNGPCGADERLFKTAVNFSNTL